MIKYLPATFYQSKRISVFILVLSALFFSFPVYSSNAEGAYRIRRIVIDPGHGGRDPGAVGLRSKEKDIVLAISLKLGNYINEYLPDVEVLYTRTTDEFIELHRRAEIANKNNADLFISIHANANTNKSVRGTDTFVLGQGRTKENLEVAMKENAAILLEDNYNEQYEGFDPNSSESYIIFSFMQSAFVGHSLNFASHVQNQFRERVGRIDRGVRQAGFLVLWQTTMPSALIEVGFISNADEERYLMSEEGQTYIASAIFRAFRDYKVSIEKRSDALFASTGRSTNGASQQEAEVKILEEVLKGQASLESSAYPIQDSNDPVLKDEIIFKVQIGSSRNRIPMNSDFFKGLSNVEVFESDGLFKYVVGNASSVEEVSAYRKELTAKFPDAFVVAIRKGNLISLKEALTNN
jgi:N-acetylmuramoyl-L-alanine amidase